MNLNTKCACGHANKDHVFQGGCSQCSECVGFKIDSKKEARNKIRRERHQAMLDLGTVRVKGALGGVYYE